MAVDQPEPTDPEIIDSGVHIRDSETSAASGWQIAMVALLVVAILCVFFYGLTSQRQEVAGSTPSSQQATNVPPPQTQPKAGTTGQGAGGTATQAPDPKNPQGAARPQQPQKTDAAPAQSNGGQNAAQPATAPQKNQ